MNTHPNEVKIIAEAAARAAVAETLLSLGIDTAHPLVAQQEFAVLREWKGLMDDDEFQADLAHLRKWRQAVESAQKTTILTMVGLLATGVVTFLWLGFKSKVGMP